jgi:ABC-type transport system involved in multi-copper enzyme maturation permease subunit
MTASIIAERPVAAPAFGRFAGLRALVRKDATEWMRGRRAWVVAALTSLFMAVSAANAWLISRIAEIDPNYVPGDHAPVSLVPLDNVAGAVGSQIFVLAAIFAVASLIVSERESGTLAWVASKPVSRTSIIVSKFVAAGVILAVTAVVVPLAVTTLTVVALYGAPDLAKVAIVASGAIAMVVFFTALGIAAGTVMPGQPAIAATGFIVFAVVPLVLGLVPLPITEYLPTSILGWAFGAASGADVGWQTPVATAGWIAATVGFAAYRMRRIEL